MPLGAVEPPDAAVLPSAGGISNARGLAGLYRTNRLGFWV
jgi:hypothetical protein